MVIDTNPSGAAEVRPAMPSGDTFDVPEVDSLAIAAIEDAILGPRTEDEPAQDDPEFEDDEDELEYDEEPEGPAEDDVPLEGQGEAEQEEPQGRRTVDEWVEVLSKDGLQRYSEVPRRMLGQVLPKLVEAAQRQVAADFAVVAQQRLEEQRQWIRWVAQVDEGFADAPDDKLQWLESGAPEAQAYQQWKRYIETDVTPEQRAQTAQSARINQAMQKQVQRLAEHPELMQELRAKAQAQPYQYDLDGLERLTDDVVELLGKAVEKRVEQRQAPQKAKARDRVAAAGTRRAAQRPIDTSRGRGVATERDISKITDPDELAAIGLSQAFANRKR